MDNKDEQVNYKETKTDEGIIGTPEEQKERLIHAYLTMEKDKNEQEEPNRRRELIHAYSKRTMDNDKEQTEQDETDTYLRTSMEEEQEPSTWEEYNEEEPLEGYDKDDPCEENDDEGKWTTQFSYPTKEEENALFIAFMTGNVEDQKTWINAKMNLARATTDEETRKREKEILDRIIPTEIKDLDEPFEEEDEEETDDLSECRTYDHDMNQEEDSADYQIYPFSLPEREKSDEFIDENTEEEDIQSLESLNISYRNHERQGEKTVNSLTTEPDGQLDKARYFSVLDVRWKYDDGHTEDENQWRINFGIDQELFDPTDIFSRPYNPPTTSRINMKEETTENTRCVTGQSRDNDLFTEPEEYTPWVAKTEHEGLLNVENQPQTNPMKLDGIAKSPTPTTTKKVESFLGSENFDTELTQNDEDLIKPQNRQDKDEQDNRDMVILPAELLLNLLNHKFDDERTFKNDDEQFDPIKTLPVHEHKPLHNQFSKVAAATSVNDVMTVKVIDMDLQKQKAMALHRDITINDVIDTLLGKKPNLWKDELKNRRIWIPRPPKNTTLTNHSTLQQSKTIQILNGKQARQSLFLSGQPDRYLAESTDNQDKILLPGETIIKTVARNIFDAPTRGILLPWNLQMSWKGENKLLFYIAAFNVGIHPGSLLIDLLQPLTSGMVVEDHEPTEGVILGFLETYTNRTTTVLCSLNKLYGLPDKSTSNQRLQVVSHKSERSIELTTNPTHYPDQNEIPERTDPKICKLFFPILEYNKKPYTTHKSAQPESNKQIPRRERFSEESKKSSTFRNLRPELLNNWRIHSVIHTSLPSSYKENDPFEENFFKPLPESTKEGYKIKSIIPKGKDLPISTKEKDVFPTHERRYRSQLDIHQQNPGFTNHIHACTENLLPDQPIRNRDRRTTTTLPTTAL